VENHSSTLEQVEDRISGLQDKIDINENTEVFLDKRLKSHKRNMQERCNSIKKPNLQIMDIEEEEKMKAKGICTIFKKIFYLIF
jgi:chromosome segregation ATPase